MWQYVIQGIKWILGDGKKVPFLEDVWIDDEGPLIHKALTVVPMNERAKLVDILGFFGWGVTFCILHRARYER